MIIENESQHKGEFTKELIQQVFQDVFYRDSQSKTRIPSITKEEWIEDGQLYHSWKIGTGSSIVYCGDEGLEQFHKAMKQINEL